MKKFIYRRITGLTLLLSCLIFAPRISDAQEFDRLERGRMKDILKIVKIEVKKNYYDPNFHGIDFEARFQKAEARMDQVTSVSQAYGVIAQVLLDFNDSHLFFSPPPTTVAVEYGWRMQAIGDKVFITEVKPGTDADKKGLKRGDRVLSINGFPPSKKELWKILYTFNGISKKESLILNVVAPGETTARELDLKSEFKRSPSQITPQTYFKFIFDNFYNEENDKHRFATFGNITVWKMPGFDYPDGIDSLVGKAKAGGSLILDLRGNSGGYVKTMERLVSSLFDRDINIAELKGRKPMDPSKAKTRGREAFTGKLIILIDSNSASAAEVLARVVQLEKRGVVLGDVSAGAVMQSRQNVQEIGTDSVIRFAISITDADLVMSDGKSLEHVGVTPDELILPTPADMAARRDPVLARAVELLGGKLSPEEAGKLMSKYYWK
jgi:C-terminal processing protease CtpA/Prc